MKVKDLIEQISQWDPEEEVCVLTYRKELFEYDQEDDVELTRDGWAKVVSAFEENGFWDIHEEILMWVQDHVTEKA